jgi:hypothetical protein
VCGVCVGGRCVWCGGGGRRVLVDRERIESNRIGSAMAIIVVVVVVVVVLYGIHRSNLRARGQSVQRIERLGTNRISISQ